MSIQKYLDTEEYWGRERICANSGYQAAAWIRGW